MKLLVMKFSSSSCYFIALRSKYNPPCSQTLSVYVLPLIWETKFRTHIKQTLNEINLNSLLMQISCPNAIDFTYAGVVCELINV
jgi:hypothetical protein